MGSAPPPAPKRWPDVPRPGGTAAAASQAAGAAAGGARQAPAKVPALSEAVDRLAADIQQLRVDFERFFSGALPFPPEDLRNRVQAQLRKLRNVNAGTAVDRFRLGDLEARYNTYSELFNRRLRDREEGRQRVTHTTLAGPSVRYDAATGIVIGRTPDPLAVEALYQGLAAGFAGAVGAGESLRFDLATFDAYLRRQAAAVRDKTGCDQVQFRLAAEDGKLKLKARPIGSARGAVS